ncbi:MAG TPA: nuclear transport factor 2 family protein [Flavisolibacter sp.]|jgi:ketosteroid isomerase-like protein|nr:nuclear transport factor 2 family protein [Flavisolibacter sp.]
MATNQLLNQFQLIDDIFNQALTTNNVEEISRYISDDWVLVQSQFGIITKDKFLHAVKEGKLVHTGMKKKVHRVQLYNDIALVTACGLNSGHFKGEAFHSEHWATNVYRKEAESWVCILSHETPVSCA